MQYLQYKKQDRRDCWSSLAVARSPLQCTILFTAQLLLVPELLLSLSVRLLFFATVDFVRLGPPARFQRLAVGWHLSMLDRRTCLSKLISKCLDRTLNLRLRVALAALERPDEGHRYSAVCTANSALRYTVSIEYRSLHRKRPRLCSRIEMT